MPFFNASQSAPSPPHPYFAADTVVEFLATKLVLPRLFESLDSYFTAGIVSSCTDFLVGFFISVRNNN